MEGFKDPTSVTRAAIVALYVFMTVDVVSTLLRVPALFSDSPLQGSVSAGATGALAVVEFVALLSCFVLVGRWIYRANANAHVFSDDMTISPGWSVGWYFIPFANLVKPYQGMKETWLASHYGNDWGSGEEPVMIRWWWLLWIVTNILSNLSFRLERAGVAESTVVSIDLVNAGLNVALCLILIRLMRQLSATQLSTSQALAFT